MQHHIDGDRAGRPLSFITESIRRRALALGKRGLHGAAAAEYQVLVDLDPQDVAAGMRLAHHCVGGGRYGAAAEEYVRVAGAYARLGHPRRAIIVALRALELAPDRVVRSRLEPLVMQLGAQAAPLCEQIARVHLLSERPQAARDVLALLVEADPSELPRRLRVAELDLSLGRRDEALVGLRIAAEGLRAHGRTEELTRTLEMMHAHGGPDESVLRELASIYIRCGQPRRALDKLEALHRVAPDDRPTVERLARVYALLGRLQTTVRMLETLVALIAEHGDRTELFTVLRRAASWSSESSYRRSVEALGSSLARPAGASRPVEPRVGSRRRTQPPPPPSWSRSMPRAQATAGEIHILDLDADAELILDHAGQ
ncbi:MAG: hypothetical protein AB1Z98_00170 [Nannocystaceae bacterium]